MFSTICPAINRLLPTLVAAALLALPACGFRGPLYLPGEAPPGAQTPAQAENDGTATDPRALAPTDTQADARKDTRVEAEDAAEERDDEGNDGEERDGDPSAPPQL